MVYMFRFKLSLHPQSGWAQAAPVKGAGISNIDYRLNEFRSDGCYRVTRTKERSDSTLHYSIFLVRYWAFAFLLTWRLSANSVMPDLIRYPVPFWIALKLDFAPFLRGNETPIVFNYWSDNFHRIGGTFPGFHQRWRI